jgi:calcineurin-like phosphoesterase family protein
MIWFTGCTHFGHANIMHLANRPFASAEEMDATLISNWNAVVKTGDTVYHLGDFGWHARDNNAILGCLNGEVIRLHGNHDPEDWGKDYLERRCDGRRIVMCHYPIEEWNGWWKGNLHLHCHTHSPDLVSGVRRFNVGVDANDFRPVSLDELLAHPNARADLR